MRPLATIQASFGLWSARNGKEHGSSYNGLHRDYYKDLQGSIPSFLANQRPVTGSCGGLFGSHAPAAAHAQNNLKFGVRDQYLGGLVLKTHCKRVPDPIVSWLAIIRG